MAHNKHRTDVTVGDVDWSKPELNALLQKIDGLSIDQRGDFSPREVRISVAHGWEAGNADKPALLVGQVEELLVLATRFPLSQGSEVRVTGLPGDGEQVRWARVERERQGARAGEAEQGLYLSWVQPHE